MSAIAQGEAAGKPAACAIVQRYGMTCPWLRASQDLEIPYADVLVLADAATHRRGLRAAHDVRKRLKAEPHIYLAHRWPGGLQSFFSAIEEYATAWHLQEITP